MHHTLRVFAVVATAYFTSGIYTEIYVINGGDHCMRRCLLNPQCKFIFYNKRDFTCSTDSKDKDDYNEIKIMRSVFENRTHQIELFPATSTVRPLWDTCIVHRWRNTCTRANVFTCHRVTESVRQTAESQCVEVKRLTVLYMCWSHGRGVHITCRAAAAWELPYPPNRRRVVMKEKLFQKTPLVRIRRRRKTITVCGTPILKTEFAIDLHKNRIVPLHFNPRFHLNTKGHHPRLSNNEVLLNFKTRMGWGPETYSKSFCFAMHRPFMVVFYQRATKYIIKSGNCTWTFKDLFHLIPQQITISDSTIKIKQVDVR